MSLCQGYYAFYQYLFRSWEDLGEDEDIIVKQNDGLSGTDKDSPKRIGQDSAESGSGTDSPAGNHKKIDKPEIEGKHRHMKFKKVKPAAHCTICLRYEFGRTCDSMLYERINM